MRATGEIQESFCGAWRAGPVVSVLDEDTLEVLHNNLHERIRLNGIDFPEKGQAYGKRAASELVYVKDAPVGWHERQPNVGQRGLVLVVKKICAE